LLTSYDTEGHIILALLPDEVTEKYDDKVVVRSNKTTKKGDELYVRNCTRMERLSISILWSKAESITDYLRDYSI